MSHPLHKAVGATLRQLEQLVPGNLLLDQACGGKQNIPLFLSNVKSNQTECCNVDAMYIFDNKIKIVFEVEESNIKPTQICGKLLTTMISRFYIHNTSKNVAIEFDENALFIQILDTSKLIYPYTSKPDQFINIEAELVKTINNLKDSPIKKYKLLLGTSHDKYNSINDDLTEFIRSELT